MPMIRLCSLLVLLAPLTFAQERELEEIGPDDFEVSVPKYEFLQPIPPKFLNREPDPATIDKESDTLSIRIKIQCPPLHKNKYEIDTCETNTEIYDDSYLKNTVRTSGWSLYKDTLELDCNTKGSFRFGELIISGEVNLQLKKWDMTDHILKVKDIIDITQTIGNVNFTVTKNSDSEFVIEYEEIINENNRLNKVDMTDKDGKQISTSYSTRITQSNNIKKISKKCEINKKANGTLIPLDKLYITIQQGVKTEPILIPFEFTLPVEFSNKQEQEGQTQPTLKQPNK